MHRHTPEAEAAIVLYSFGASLSVAADSVGACLIASTAIFPFSDKR